MLNLVLPQSPSDLYSDQLTATYIHLPATLTMSSTTRYTLGTLLGTEKCLSNIFLFKPTFINFFHILYITTQAE